jgi:hypothetical protein
VHDYRQNDVIWPARQTQIIQKFNGRVQNPQTHFKLLTRGVLGNYMPDQQQFVFHPLDSAAFEFQFPANLAYGMENDCPQTSNPLSPLAPWPKEFVLGFNNPGLITALPMPKDQAEFFVANLPKDSKGQYDRHVILEIEFDVTGFEPNQTKSAEISSDRKLSPVGVLATAQGAVIYSNTQMTKELARFGTVTPPATPAPPK